MEPVSELEGLGTEGVYSLLPQQESPDGPAKTSRFYDTPILKHDDLRVTTKPKKNPTESTHSVKRKFLDQLYCT